MRRTAWLGSAVAALVLAAGVVACGSDDEDGPTGGTQTGGSGGSTGGTGGLATGGTAGKATGGAGGSVAGGGGAGGSVAGGGGAGGSVAGGGGAGGGGASGSAGAKQCTTITLEQLGPAGPGSGSTLASNYSPDTGSDAADFFTLLLWESDTEKQSTGEFDLSQAPDDNYSTCLRCLLVYEDVEGATAGKFYYQESGTMTLESVQSPPTPVSKGSLQGVKLVEVTFADDGVVSEPVPNGECLIIESASWDTTSVTDAVCADAEAECEACCSDFHPGGYDVYLGAVEACVCTEAHCQTACGDTFCSEAMSEPDEDCMTCVSPLLDPTGACYPAVVQACGADDDCQAFETCVSACPS